jgi:hypothetical protein
LRWNKKMEDAVGGGEKLKETEREIKEEGGRER